MPLSTEKKTVIYIAAGFVGLMSGYVASAAGFRLAGALLPIVAVQVARKFAQWLDQRGPAPRNRCRKCKYPLEPFMQVCPECGHAEEQIVVTVSKRDWEAREAARRWGL